MTSSRPPNHIPHALQLLRASSKSFRQKLAIDKGITPLVYALSLAMEGTASMLLDHAVNRLKDNKDQLAAYLNTRCSGATALFRWAWLGGQAGWREGVRLHRGIMFREIMGWQGLQCLLKLADYLDLLWALALCEQSVNNNLHVFSLQVRRAASRQPAGFQAAGCGRQTAGLLPEWPGQRGDHAPAPHHCSQARRV